MVTVADVLNEVLGILVLALFLFAIGWVSGRILGVRRGFWRAAVAAIVGYIAGDILINVQYGGQTEFNDVGDAARLGLGFIGYVLLVTMLTSIILEVLLRPRPDRRGVRLPHPIRAIRRRLDTVGRLRDIVRAARRNGLVGRRFRSVAALSTPEGAHALRLTLEECGGMFVKFGQIASTREDLLPATMTEELAQLRSAVKPLPPETVRRVVETELSAPLESVFASFDLEALAAASIGVTHRATLLDGRDVIVKVQRPDVEEVVRRDARVMQWAAGQLERRSDSAARLGVRGLVDELVAGVIEELDFTREAANNAAMRRARVNDPGVEFPEIYRAMTTRRVLVMDRVTGVSVDHEAAVDRSGVPRDQLADRLLHSFLAQVLNDGIYHADPHPGNVLLDSAGEMWLIDYGAVGHLDPVTLEALQQLAMGFMMRDPSLLARAVRRLAGAQGEGLDMVALEFELGVVLTDVSTGGFDPAALQQVVRVLRRHGVPAPRALTVLARAALTLEGTLRLVDPEFRMAVRAQEELPSIVGVEQLNPRDMLVKEAVRAVPSLRALPQLTEDIALQARSGRLTLRTARDDVDTGQLDRWVDRALLASLGMLGLLSSSLLLVAGGLAGNEEFATYLRAIGFVGIIVSTAIQMRVVAQILRRRPPGDNG